MSDHARLDFNLIEKLRAVGNRHEGRCPACAETDGDKKGNHLSIDADERWTCIMFPGAEGKEHRSRIRALVGIKDGTNYRRPVRATYTKPVREPWKPYEMTNAELEQCVSMAKALANNPDALQRIAKARAWQPETIRLLAVELCLGIHEGKLVMIYPTGAKQRLKPLTKGQQHHGAAFRQLFGKPSLWMGDRILRCTEKVHIVEGESAAIALCDAGLDNGTTNLVMATPGASSWRREWASRFAGLEVLIWPDADEAGEKHASAILDSLQGIARSVRIVRMEGGIV